MAHIPASIFAIFHAALGLTSPKNRQIVPVPIPRAVNGSGTGSVGREQMFPLADSRKTTGPGGKKTLASSTRTRQYESNRMFPTHPR
jgi:hypothetical protein